MLLPSDGELWGHFSHVEEVTCSKSKADGRAGHSGRRLFKFLTACQQEGKGFLSVFGLERLLGQVLC